MAKKLSNNTWAPGVIYELRCLINNEWHPFYVGETTDAIKRLQQHNYAGRTATAESTAVYRFIHDQLNANSIEWDMTVVEHYGNEGPTDLEDEHIMRLIVDGIVLRNEKKGNANWMAERLSVAKDMRSRGLTSYRKYRAVLTAEQEQEKLELKQAAWEAKQVAEAARSYAQNLIAEMNELARLHRIEQEKRDLEKKLKQAAKDAELAEHRRKQQEAWMAQAAIRKEQEAIAQAERDEEMRKAREDARQAHKQKELDMDKQVNTVITALGYAPLTGHETTLFTSLFETKGKE